MNLRTWVAIADYLVTTFPDCVKTFDVGREVVRASGKVFAYLAANERSKPPDAPANEEYVITRIDLERRAELLESNPDVYFVTPHYQNYTGVIVRLTTADPKQFKKLLTESWRFIAPKKLVREWDASHSE